MYVGSCGTASIRGLPFKFSKVVVNYLEPN